MLQTAFFKIKLRENEWNYNKVRLMLHQCRTNPGLNTAPGICFTLASADHQNLRNKA